MNELAEQLDINNDINKTNKEVVFSYLSKESYWAKDIPRPIFEKSLENSLCFNLILNKKQIGFARIISDYATYAYLADVFIIEKYRGNGYSKQLMQSICDHPDLQNLRRITLATSDAHGLYQNFGFTQLKSPQIFMEKHQPGLYLKLKSGS